MNHPDYIANIEIAAERAAAETVTPVEQLVWDRWLKFEKLANELQDDILARNAHQVPDLRQAIRQLIRALYIASPGTIPADCQQIREKNAEYGGSWVKRGGRGAFHALARKADRIEEQIRIHHKFADARSSKAGESIDDTLGDLRRYLILVEAYHIAREENEYPVVEATCACGHPRGSHSPSDGSCVRCTCKDFCQKEEFQF